MYVCEWDMCWRNFRNSSLVTKNVKSRSKIELFSNERHFEIWFSKKKIITFFWSKVSKLHKKRPNFACDNYIFSKTRGNKNKQWTHSTPVKGTEMGSLLALVCPYFRKNAIVTCNIVSFSCSLDNFLLKNVIVFIFWIHILYKLASIWKNGYFRPIFHIYLSPGERQKNSFSTYLTSHEDTYFAHLSTFFALSILQKIRMYLTWFLFGVPLGVDSYSRHFGAINE